MGRVGILREDSRVELLEGELIDMSPIGSVHLSVVNTLTMIFARQVGDVAIVSTQNPVSLLPDSEPQPDIALLRPRQDRYRNALPVATDVLLIVEVSDTSIEYDRQVKLPLYAQHGIPEVWIIDLQAGCMEIYRDPNERGYRKLLQRNRGDIASPTLASAVSVALNELWPD